MVRMPSCQRRLDELEETAMASLQNGRSHGLEDLEATFAPLFEALERAIPFEFVSKIAADKLKAIDGRLQKYAGQCIEKLETHVDEADVKAADSCLTQLEYLQDFAQGAFAAHLGKVEQKSSGFSGSSHFKEALAAMDSEAVGKLGRQGASKLERKVQALLKQDSFDEVAKAFDQVSYLDRMLGSSEVSSKLYRQWCEAVKRKMKELNDKARSSNGQDAELFEALAKQDLMQKCFQDIAELDFCLESATDVQRRLDELEETAMASLQNGRSHGLEDLEATFAPLFEALERAIPFEFVSKIAADKLKAIDGRLQKYAGQCIEKLETHVDEADVKAADSCLTQLEYLQDFAQGAFTAHLGKVEQKSSGFSGSSHFKEALAAMDSEAVGKLGRQGASKLERKVQALLKQDSFDEVAKAFDQVSYLDRMLGSSEVSSRLYRQWCEAVKRKMKELNDKARSSNGQDAELFEALAKQDLMQKCFQDIAELDFRLESATDVQRRLDELEETAMASLQNGRSHGLEDLEATFAPLFEALERAIPFEFVSKIAADKLKAIDGRLQKYARQCIEKLETHVDEADVKAADSCLTQLEYLQDFAQGAFTAHLGKVEQKSSGFSGSSHFKEALAAMDSEAVGKLGRQGASKFERKVQALLKQDSFDEVAKAFDQASYLDRMLGSSEVSSKLYRQWCEAVKRKMKELNDKARSSNGQDAELFEALAKQDLMQKCFQDIAELDFRLESATDVQRRLDELEETAMASLQNGRSHGLEDLEATFAPLFEALERAIPFEFVSKIAADKLKAIDGRLQKYAGQCIEKLETHVDEADVKAADSCLTQLEYLQDFAQGAFTAHLGKVEQKSSGFSGSSHFKEALAAMDSEAVGKLGRQGASKLERKVQALLKQDSFDEVAKAFDQVSYLDRMLGSSEVSSRLYRQWCEAVKRKMKELNDKARSSNGQDAELFEALAKQDLMQKCFQDIAELDFRLESATDVQRRLDELEETAMASLQNGRSHGLEDLEATFAPLFEALERAIPFEFVSKIAADKLKAIDGRLQKYAGQCIEKLETHVDEADVKAADSCLTQLEYLQDFAQGAFTAHLGKVEQKSSGFSGSSHFKEALAAMDSEAVGKLGRQGASKLERKVQALLKQDSFDEVAKAFDQVSYLDRMLGSSEVSSKLYRQWCEAVNSRMKELDSQARAGFEEGTAFLEAIKKLGSIKVGLEKHLPEAAKMLGEWKRRISNRIEELGRSASDQIQKLRDDSRDSMTAVGLARELIALACLHLQLPPALEEGRGTAYHYIHELLEECSDCPNHHELIARLNKALRSEGQADESQKWGLWIAETFKHFREWRTVDFNKRVMKSEDDVLKEWNLEGQREAAMAEGSSDR